MPQEMPRRGRGAELELLRKEAAETGERVLRDQGSRSGAF